MWTLIVVANRVIGPKVILKAFFSAVGFLLCTQWTSLHCVALLTNLHLPPLRGWLLCKTQSPGGWATAFLNVILLGTKKTSLYIQVIVCYLRKCYRQAIKKKKMKKTHYIRARMVLFCPCLAMPTLHTTLQLIVLCDKLWRALLWKYSGVVLLFEILPFVLELLLASSAVK